MNTHSMLCSQCQATLKYNEALFGKTLSCPRCQARVTIPFPEVDPLTNEPDMIAEVVDEPTVQDAPGPMNGSTISSQTKKKKKKKKTKKKKGWEMPAIVLEPIVWQALSCIIGIGLVVLAFYYLTRWPDAEQFDQAMWREHDVAPYFKVMLPGTAKHETQQHAGITMQLLQSQPLKEAVFGVAYSNGQLPPGRLQDGPEIMLTDACNGSAANLEKMGAVETSRKSIKLKGYPGKQLIMKVSEAKGYMIMRHYLVGPRLYSAIVGGRGLHEKHPNVVKFFESFDITEVLGQPVEPEKPPQGSSNEKTPPSLK